MFIVLHRDLAGSRLGRAMIGALLSKKTQYAKFWNLATSSHSYGVKMATKSHRLFMLVLILPTIISISCIEIYKTVFRKGEFITFGICGSYAEATQLCCY